MESVLIDGSWVGRHVDGKFTLLEWLGGSGPSGVFRTELKEGPRAQNASIKLIAAEGFEADAQLAAWAEAVKLSHPHLMPVFRSGRWRVDGVSLIYVVTEYADEVLSKVLLERPIAPSEAKEMLSPVVGALGYLHRNRLVHGHLKPSNILVVDNRLKISGDSLQAAGRFRKKAAELDAYDAPELAVAPVSPAADVWSLGVTLVEALTQALPENAGGNEDPRLPEGMPQPFAGIARECLRRNSVRRMTLAEIEARLGAAEAVADVGDEEDSAPASKKPWIVLVLGTALVAAIVIAVVMVRGHHAAPVQPPATTGVPTASQSADSAASPNAPSAAHGGNSAPPNSATAPASAPAQPEASGGSAASAPAATPASKPSPAQPAPVQHEPVQRLPVQPEPASVSTGSPAAANSAVAQQFLPAIPASASRTIQGKVDVVVRAAVDGAGNVTAATLATPGPSKYFANQALESSRNWKFKPQAAGSVWLLHFQFRQSGVEATATQLTR